VVIVINIYIYHIYIYPVLLVKSFL
jgi:hypothetical protein